MCTGDDTQEGELGSHLSSASLTLLFHEKVNLSVSAGNEIRTRTPFGSGF